MIEHFSNLPQVVIDYVRRIFSAANDKVSRTMSLHPSMYEETLDHILIMELTAAPAAFFAQERVGVSLESHWLGNRWMLGRWEIADIAFFVLLRRRGQLLARKVALLQTKRLYSKEIDVVALDDADYRIGIGRLVDKTDPLVPLSNQRAFSFDFDCVYGATHSRHPQVSHIAEYMAANHIPVYYGLYNPTSLPLTASYPSLNGSVSDEPNTFGCRIIPAVNVHSRLESLDEGKAPSVNDLRSEQAFDSQDEYSAFGWRIERFIADEVLRCKQGRVFDDLHDPNLRGLLYARTAPIAAAITISIDYGGDL